MEDRNKEVFKRIKKMKEDGLSNQKIADKLNDENVPTFSNRGTWSKATVHKIVKKTPTYLTE